MWYADILKFFDDHAAAITAAVAVVVVIGAAIRFVLFGKEKAAAPDPEVAKIVATLQEGHRNQLEDAAQREETLRNQVGQLTEAVQALSNERDKPDAPAGIDEALALLAKGETSAAEAVFQSVKERRKAEGTEAFKEAAAAARYIGALAFLHDTDKALAAYREAVDLDPDNADGWNQLGHLLMRRGDLDDAAGAYQRVLSLGNSVDDKAVIAVATGNLGILYKTRGDLDAAEDMYRKSLAIEEALGRKEGMASDYGNLGNLYRARGDLDAAEDMYRESLAIGEALGRKEGMANQYGNLGILYKTRGDLDAAEDMYRKSLSLFREVGAAPRIEHVEQLLADLRHPE